MAKRIAIQGYEGSFHHMAAMQYYNNDVEVLPCNTFKEVVKLASTKKESDGGIMAIENSIAGSILPNYTLLQKSQLTITGEVYLHISQNLLAYPGVALSDVKEVHSHYMALLQCSDFLEKHNWKLQETEDTALSAKWVAKKKSPTVAAIASKLAAELFELEVLVPDIHTEKDNYTRFLVLEKKAASRKVEQADKASVNFITDHSKGSLAKVLSVIADNGINLSKLQSMPIAGTRFNYSFHADMEFETLKQYEHVIKRLAPVTQQLKVLGVYKNGNRLNAS